MNKYFFILGRNPALSIAEIFSILDSWKIKHSLVLSSEETAVIGTDGNIDCNMFMAKSGGTVKAGKIIDQIGLDEDQTYFGKILSAENLLRKYFPERKGKIHFGISLYDGGSNVRLINLMSKKLLEFNSTVKKNLKEKGISSGFLRIKERNISSVSVSKNRLLKGGAEIVMIVTDNMIFLGHTVAVQEFASFGYRDMARPNKDKRSGIMPPKLARIMINLARAGCNSVLLDPFCGSGTIIQEAVILGVKKIIGADITPRAVSDTRQNLDWMFEKFTPGNKKFNKENYNISIFQSDVKNITDKIGLNYIDAIVTEPYLGPPLFSKPKPDIIDRIFSEVSELYIDSFRQFKNIVKIGGRVMIIFPSFEHSGKIYFSEVISRIENEGFMKEKFFPDDVNLSPKIRLSDRSTILYSGNNQSLVREILSFIRIK